MFVVLARMVFNSIEQSLASLSHSVYIVYQNEALFNFFFGRKTEFSFGETLNAVFIRQTTFYCFSTSFIRALFFTVKLEMVSCAEIVFP